MFSEMPQSMMARMKYLESADAADRVDGTSPALRLRQISAETVRFLALLAAMAPAGDFIEIGTSAGYSTMWLSRASSENSARITTFEISPEKSSLARETFTQARIDKLVRLVEGDARRYVAQFSHIAFCFLDADKDVYAECYELIVPRLVAGGLLVADNAISHRATLEGMLNRALVDERVDAVVADIGKGLLLFRQRDSRP